MINSDILEAAIDAVQQACGLARRIQGELLRDTDVTRGSGGVPGALAKSDASPVTVADFAIQALVAARLERELGPGGFRLVGEESAGALREAEQSAVRDAVIAAVHSVDPDLSSDDVLRVIDLGHTRDGAARDADAFWTIDPIDGTKGFLRGGQYAICLAAIEGPDVVAAIMGCPNLPLRGLPEEAPPDHGTLLVAQRGAGCWQRSERRSTESGTRVRRAPIDPDGEIILCESVESRSMAPARREHLLDEARLRRRAVRLDSQCKYALVARGDADLYLRIPRRSLPFECIWDHASGVLCVTEAGGAASDLDGRPLDFGLGHLLSDNRGVIACATEVQARLLEAATRVDLDPASA